ncbi:hypothetical protein C173_12767 [Paenibacillus sp. FSL R7-277]|uniref:hypothetical protein n=1 Tax=Paenibacillus sp. FSL R7-277 TaxID=1227352 RepID=UPI0003E28055|nr:hypothetical protein [Paenibacillus sp. FSL R7-277]ETT72919.1 hypothetical protein C173_12767 [Paenibacillus sp. FSL R7-277]
MRIKMLIVLTVVVLLSGCSKGDRIKGSSEIDWVDFVKINGVSYSGSWDRVIKNPSQVTTEIVGKVDFKVADVVTNPDYRIKDGDAAFLEKGTPLYRVEGFKTNEVIAAMDEASIGGYRIYVEDDFTKNVRQSYKDINKDKIERIELFRLENVKPYRTLSDSEAKRFIHLLESGKNTQNYTPQNKEGDPEYYKVVYYTDQPIAYAFSLADDGVEVFFSPGDTRIVDKEIRTLIQP